MANDITLAINSNPIKNGTLLVQCKATGFSSNDTYNQYVKNIPTINNIEYKYDGRFDNPSYYYGGGIGSVNGGDVGGSGSNGDNGIYYGGTYEG